MQNFQASSSDLRQQIESAYKKRAGVISFPKKTRERTTDFAYCGHVSPFSSKSDRFHVGRFMPGLKLPHTIKIGTSIMRECCGNFVFTPLQLSNEDVNEGLAALKRMKMTRAAVREFIVPRLPSPHHRFAIQDLDNDLFEVVDVLTAIGRAEPESYVALGLFCGLLLDTRCAPSRCMFLLILIAIFWLAVAQSRNQITGRDYRLDDCDLSDSARAVSVTECYQPMIGTDRWAVRFAAARSATAPTASARMLS